MKAGSAPSRAAGETDAVRLSGDQHPSTRPGDAHTAASRSHTAASGEQLVPDSHTDPGKSRNLLVVICPCWLFVTFQAAAVLHLGSPLCSACASAGAAGTSPCPHVTCSSSAAEAAPFAACHLPASENALFPATLHGAASFCCKPPPLRQPFAWGGEMSPSTTHCVIKNGSCVAAKPGERLVNPACSSLPAPPASISSGFSSERESGDFVTPPAREACGGAKFCPAPAGR